MIKYSRPDTALVYVGLFWSPAPRLVQQGEINRIVFIIIIFIFAAVYHISMVQTGPFMIYVGKWKQAAMHEPGIMLRFARVS